MYQLLVQLFIPNSQDKKYPHVREKYGTVFSIFGIVCNFILVIIKLVISFITNSISIRTDALNNLSDIGSNVATLCGFKLANKHADKDHPYGHGRMEYISGMIVSFLIILMAIEALKTSIEKIITPEQLQYSNVALFILIISILIKLLMYKVNNQAGKDIESDSLCAAGQDSLNDSITTFSSLLVLLIDHFFHMNIDAYVGIIVSFMILKSGIEIFKRVMDTILGKAPDKELIEDIKKDVLVHPEIHGIHDLMVHDYGLSQRFMTFHAEVSNKEDITQIHDTIDNIEREIYQKYKIIPTIHMDPIDYDDPYTQDLKQKIETIVKNINSEFSIHDFRIVKGQTHTNIVFDCLIPSDEKLSHSVISNKIQEEVNKLPDGPYYCVIQVEHSFI